MHSNVGHIAAINGDGWACPASTITSVWAALGAGAEYLSLSVYLTADGVPVCAPSANLKTSCGVDKEVSDLTFDSFQALDAGAIFCSTNLDDSLQPTGVRGEDRPWRGLTQEYPLKNRDHLCYPSLKQLYELFGRRSRIGIRIENDAPIDSENYLNQLVEITEKFGLLERVTFIASQSALEKIHSIHPSANLCLYSCTAPSEEELDALSALNGGQVYVKFEDLAALPDAKRIALFDYAKVKKLAWRLGSESMPYAPLPAALETLAAWQFVALTWETPGTFPCRQALTPFSEVFSEAFAGTDLNTSYWAAGYSHQNLETEIYIDDSLIIDISKGRTYSGGAAICLLPIFGDFDAEVCFHVANPHQATTFELAAIGIDPGYHNMDNEDLTSKKVNLTFDVHGAPPYASSERDQNDGFRCGWNNSFNFARVGDDWQASSVNMYNKYGRDVGDGGSNNLEGKLRLVRRRDVFNSYYQDKHNGEWVCSGTMLVQCLPGTAYLRLAAKHWNKLKPKPAPRNTVSFWNFKLRQPG